jgi:Protein phosphatase 2C
MSCFPDRLAHVKVTMASDAGHVGRPNEDFVGAVPGAVVLLDGAGIRGTDSICHHGAAWYSHTLGTTLLGQLSREPRVDLIAALAESIGQVSGQHRRTCDVDNPSSPQSTVAIVRFDADRVDLLVLADVFVVVDPSEAGPQVITDSREVSVRSECSAVLRGLSVGTPEYERTKLSVIDALRARRNQPGGYWIAKEDPQAAAHAVTGSVPLSQLDGVALLSNGASRVVDPYRLAPWPGVLDLIRTKGPGEILRRVRAAETETSATDSSAAIRHPDDATIAYCEPAEPTT